MANQQDCVTVRPNRVIVITGVKPFLKRAHRVVLDDDDTDDEQ